MAENTFSADRLAEIAIILISSTGDVQNSLSTEYDNFRYSIHPYVPLDGKRIFLYVSSKVNIGSLYTVTIQKSEVLPIEGLSKDKIVEKFQEMWTDLVNRDYQLKHTLESVGWSF